ncbi:hypothetical protein DQ04_13571000, partial [Trypanosoma grayi]|uniref:hypothetical protein n=1 Tax=Trypanosoma grayi TaxID=71804 RepID=UPI0004F49FE8
MVAVRQVVFVFALALCCVSFCAAADTPQLDADPERAELQKASRPSVSSPSKPHDQHEAVGHKSRLTANTADGQSSTHSSEGQQLQSAAVDCKASAEEAAAKATEAAGSATEAATDAMRASEAATESIRIFRLPHTKANEEMVVDVDKAEEKANEAAQLANSSAEKATLSKTLLEKAKELLETILLAEKKGTEVKDNVNKAVTHATEAVARADSAAKSAKTAATSAAEAANSYKRREDFGSFTAASAADNTKWAATQAEKAAKSAKAVAQVAGMVITTLSVAPEVPDAVTMPPAPEEGPKEPLAALVSEQETPNEGAASIPPQATASARPTGNAPEETKETQSAAPPSEDVATGVSQINMAADASDSPAWVRGVPLLLLSALALLA